MSRTVFCRKYQQELEGLPNPPFPGPKGQDIYDNVSAKAWQEWIALRRKRFWNRVGSRRIRYWGTLCGTFPN